MDCARLSVIIPTRNRLEFLREAVASVLAQSFTGWELIVVDDCSQDGTWAWLQSLDDPRIHILRMENHRERSAARNAGLRAANGEYVLFLDDDDWLLEGALARLFNALRLHPTAVAAVGAYVYKNDWGSWNRATHPRRRVFQSIWPDLMFGWLPLQGQSLLRRSAVLKAGGWNEMVSFGEDYDFSLRLWRLGYAVLIPQAVMAYRRHPGQTAKASAWPLTVNLRRNAAASLSEADRVKAERLIQAHRRLRQAWRARERRHSWKALIWWWQAASYAPGLLASSVSRAIIVETGTRCFVHVILGDWLTGNLRKLKRSCIRACKGELRTPDLIVPTAKAIRGTGNQA